MELPDQLFSTASLASVGGATVIVTVVTNALRQLTSAPAKWIAFITALLISSLVVVLNDARLWHDWILAFFNACLVFCTALGLNEVGGAATAKPGKGFAQLESFFAPWLRISQVG